MTLQPLPNNSRLEITEGMSVEKFMEEGKDTQKRVASIFNGDGVYSDREVYKFNNTGITADLNKNETKKADSTKRTAQDQKVVQTMTRFGLAHINTGWINIDDCEVQTKNGQSVLVLKSSIEGFELSLPIDKDYNPSEIEIYRAEDEHNIHFMNVKGSIKLNADEDWKSMYAFEGNSDIKVEGRSGKADSIAIEDNAKVTYTTDDYADKIEDRTRVTKDGMPVVNHLKPGTTTVQGAGKLDSEE